MPLRLSDGSWIAGSPVRGSSGESWDVVDPVTNRTVDPVALAGSADLDGADLDGADLDGAAQGAAPGASRASGFGTDMSTYSLEEYTVVKHVMSDLTGEVRTGRHRTIVKGG